MANPRTAPRPTKKSTKRRDFRLTYLPANQRWVVTWGEQIIPINPRDAGPEIRSFSSKREAVAALKRVGLKVHPSGVIVNA
jgi:hypothetical protein